MDEWIKHIISIKGFFLDDRRLISYVSHRPGNGDISLIWEKMNTMAHQLKGEVLLPKHSLVQVKKLGLDAALTRGDLSVVNRMAHEFPGDEFTLVQLISRYCAAHAPEHYPLWGRHSLNALELKCGVRFAPDDYETYSTIMRAIRSDNGMQQLNYFDINKFFWIYEGQLETADFDIPREYYAHLK